MGRSKVGEKMEAKELMNEIEHRKEVMKARNKRNREAQKLLTKKRESQESNNKSNADKD